MVSEPSGPTTSGEGQSAVHDPIGSPVPEAAPRSGGALLRGGGWSTIGQFAPLIVNLALTPYVIHGLGLARFGLYVLASTIADFLGTCDGGIYSSAQRYFAVYAGTSDRRSTSRLFLSLVVGVLSIGSVMIALLFLTAPTLLRLFHVPIGLRGEGQFLLRTLGIVIVLEILRGVFTAILAARQRFALSSLTIAAQYGVYAVGIILTVHEHWGLRGVAVTLVLQMTISTAVLAGPAFRYVDPRELRLLPRDELRDFARYASRAQVAGLSDLINLQSDSLLIGGFLSVRSVAFYSSGRNFASQIRAVPWNAIAPAGALLGRTFGQHGQAGVLPQFRVFQRWWVQGCTGWVAVAAAAAFFGVTKWLGPGFELSGTVAVVLLVGYLFRLWAGMMTVYCQAVGHPELEARYGLVSVLVNLALTFALVVPLGVVGVVVATALGQFVGSLYLLHIVRARLSSAIPSFVGEIPWRAAVAAAGATTALQLLARPWITEGPLGLIEAGLVALPGLVVFVVVLLGPSGAWRQGRAGLDRVSALVRARLDR